MAIHTFIKIQLHYPSFFLHSFPIPFLKFITKIKVVFTKPSQETHTHEKKKKTVHLTYTNYIVGFIHTLPLKRFSKEKPRVERGATIIMQIIKPES